MRITYHLRDMEDHAMPDEKFCMLIKVPVSRYPGNNRLDVYSRWSTGDYRWFELRHSYLYGRAGWRAYDN